MKEHILAGLFALGVGVLGFVVIPAIKLGEWF